MAKKTPAKPKKPSPRKARNPKQEKKPKEYELFVEFLSLPYPEKCAMLEIPIDPDTGDYTDRPTQKMFAAKYGVSEATVSIWANDERTLKESKRLNMKWGMQRVPDVLGALYQNALQSGNKAEVELFLNYFEGWAKDQVVKLVDDRFDKDDLRAIAAAMPKEQGDEFLRQVADGIAKAQVARFDK